MSRILIIAALLCGLCSSLVYAQTIGDVIIQKGNAVIEQQGEEKVSIEGLDVFSYDVVKTGDGRTAIEFVDETRVDVTEHSKLIIDEFVYDPANDLGSISIKASLGTMP